MNPIRERLGAIRYRLFGFCWAQGCGLPIALHMRRRLSRCLDKPVALALTDQGWLQASYSEAVVPVSHAS